jgi:hypothetical protein
MERVAVIGPAGAGKSFLAGELGRRLDLPVVHIDQLYWQPGWVRTPIAEFEELQRRRIDEPPWIVDAQHDDIVPDWLEAADTVVFLDVSALRCLWRASRRRLEPEPAHGGPSGGPPSPAHRALAKFVRGQWHYRTRFRRELLDELSKQRNGRRVFVLRRDSDVRQFLDSVDSPVPAGGIS